MRKSTQPFNWRDHITLTDVTPNALTVIDNKTGATLRVWGVLASELTGNLDALDRARAAA